MYRYWSPGGHENGKSRLNCHNNTSRELSTIIEEYKEKNASLTGAPIGKYHPWSYNKHLHPHEFIDLKILEYQSEVKTTYLYHDPQLGLHKISTYNMI